MDFPASLGILCGYQGFSHNMIEIGLAYGTESSILAFGLNRKTVERIKKPHAIYYGSYHIDPFDRIKGALIGFSISSGLVFGCDFNYYSYESNFFGFRPSVGIALVGTEIAYRYNFKISGEKMPAVSGHLFTVRYYLPLFIKSDNSWKFGTRY